MAIGLGAEVKYRNPGLGHLVGTVSSSPNGVWWRLSEDGEMEYWISWSGSDLKDGWYKRSLLVKT